MSTDLTTRPETALTIAPEQGAFTPAQVSALEHMGLTNVPDGDLAVFFHQCKRTGLDPFLRQIHMIGRKAKRWDPEARREFYDVKYTIQTGIDGYRLIGHRAAREAGAEIAVAAPEWLHESGKWFGAWSKKWGVPVAARVTIHRGERSFSAVANFDEYAQTFRKNGEERLTSMWEQRPAGQIAKCAEALCWRLAFPQDLSGIYTAEEMAQAENRGETPVTGNVGEASAPAPTTAQRDAQDAATAREAHTAAEAPQAPHAGEDGVVDAEIVEDAPQGAPAPQGGGFDPEGALRGVWNNLAGLRRLHTWLEGVTPNPTPEQADYLARVAARGQELAAETSAA